MVYRLSVRIVPAVPILVMTPPVGEQMRKPIERWRLAGIAVVVVAGYWFDRSGVNSYVSTLVIVAGMFVLLVGPDWVGDRSGSKERTAIPYVWRVAAGCLVLVFSLWLLSVSYLSMSATTTCVSFALLTYQAPWLQRMFLPSRTSP